MIKKFIYILILFIFFINAASAQMQKIELKYTDPNYAFKAGDDKVFLQNAEKNMNLCDTANDNTKKRFYIKEAMRYYFLLQKMNPSSIEAQIGLARFYDEIKYDRMAKKHFFNAYNMDNQNPKMNLYFGNFYYKRSDFITALQYYQRAYKYGYLNNFQLNCKLGEAYEKLGDIETAKVFYKYALKLKPNDASIDGKLQTLDGLNYGNSQYYLFPTNLRPKE